MRDITRKKSNNTNCLTDSAMIKKFRFNWKKQQLVLVVLDFRNTVNPNILIELL